MENERKVELVKEFYELDITHDVSNFENVDCTIYNESSADGYDLFVITNDTKRVSICEDVYYYDHDLALRFNEHIRWGDKTFYIEKYLFRFIGFSEPIMPLAESVASAARSAAFEHPRFHPLKKEQMAKMKIELSVHTNHEEIKVKHPSEYFKNVKMGYFHIVILVHVLLQ